MKGLVSWRCNSSDSDPMQIEIPVKYIENYMNIIFLNLKT